MHAATVFNPTNIILGTGFRLTCKIKRPGKRSIPSFCCCCWNASVFFSSASAFVLGFAFSVINNASGSLVCSLWGGLGNSVSPPGHKSRRKKKAVRNRNWKSQHAFAGSGWPSVRSYRIFGTRMSSQAHHSPLMIKPPWQIRVCDTWQTGVCVFDLVGFECCFSSSGRMARSVWQKSAKSFPTKRLLMMTGIGPVRGGQLLLLFFNSCLFLWLLKAH